MKIKSLCFKRAGRWLYHVLIEALQHTCGTAYRNYEEALGFGIAKEVARMALPLNLFSTAYVTMNARGLMNFLSLRVKSEDSKYPSFPMWEINQVANKMELDFSEKMPLTHESFVITEGSSHESEVDSLHGLSELQ